MLSIAYCPDPLWARAVLLHAYCPDPLRPRAVLWTDQNGHPVADFPPNRSSVFAVEDVTDVLRAVLVEASRLSVVRPREEPALFDLDGCSNIVGEETMYLGILSSLLAHDQSSDQSLVLRRVLPLQEVYCVASARGNTVEHHFHHHFSTASGTPFPPRAHSRPTGDYGHVVEMVFH